MKVQSAIDNRQSPIAPYSIPILSVCQPYAHLIVHGPKRIENRTWATRHRGWIGIHASRGKKYLADADEYQQWLGTAADSQSSKFKVQNTPLRTSHFELGTLVFGAVIGIAKLVECVDTRPATCDDFVANEYHWVFADPWFEGPVGWVLEGARAIVPIVCRGKTGLFRMVRRMA